MNIQDFRYYLLFFWRSLKCPLDYIKSSNMLDKTKKIEL